jgi:transcriptional regulator with XRE-family HTH domain
LVFACSPFTGTRDLASAAWHTFQSDSVGLAPCRWIIGNIPIALYALGMEKQLGDRLAKCIDALEPRVKRKDFAARIGLTPDALSRALSGQRGISSVELVKMAEVLDADIHELVTGVPDPRRVSLAARHDFDRNTWARTIPTYDDDKSTIENIRIAYAQASLTTREVTQAPADPSVMRELLGDGFARPFIDRIESELKVDVIRVAELGTAYTATIGGRSVIMIPAKGNWFRENWDLAHELAHHAGIETEDAANAYAAKLLLPDALMANVDWVNASPQTVADVLWETGVSTEALRNRLVTLRLRVDSARDVLTLPTQRALRLARSWSHTFGDEITERMDSAAQRRFPLELQEAHEQKIEAGELGPAYLAWMRGVSAQWIAEAYEPGMNEVKLDELSEAFGLELT